MERTRSFQRNSELEVFLHELNGHLALAEQDALTGIADQPRLPLLFVVGPLRSGTTLMMQWLASSGAFAYPTNLLSRFYKAPVIGSKIQLLLTDERYNFRDELKIPAGQIEFSSENGKTRGPLAPNEFWYFWRRFLPFEEIDYLPTEQLLEKVDTKTMLHELAGVVEAFGKPLAMKGMILNFNLDFLDRILDNVLFVYMKRDPAANMASALSARERQLGDANKWYSFKIPQYATLKDLPPEQQVAGQIFYTHEAIGTALARIAEQRKIVVPYEDFCHRPGYYYGEIQERLRASACEIPDYAGPTSFTVSDITDSQREKMSEIYRSMGGPAREGESGAH